MEKICFFIAPIGTPDSFIRRRSDRVLDRLLAPTLKRLGYRVIRLDRLAVLGSLSVQIRALIRQADLVVADLTGANANVFYELGFRHATGRPCLQLIEEGEQLPFDVADIRTLLINSTSNSKLLSAAATLSEQVCAAERHARSPVTAPSEEEIAFVAGSAELELESHLAALANAALRASVRESSLAEQPADDTSEKQHDARNHRDTTPALRLPTDREKYSRRWSLLPLAA